MELVQPTEEMSVHDPLDTEDWYKTPVSAGEALPVADNIIALVIRPLRSRADDPAQSPGEFSFLTLQENSQVLPGVTGTFGPTTRRSLPPSRCCRSECCFFRTHGIPGPKRTSRNRGR